MVMGLRVPIRGPPKCPQKLGSPFRLRRDSGFRGYSSTGVEIEGYIGFRFVRIIWKKQWESEVRRFPLSRLHWFL